MTGLSEFEQTLDYLYSLLPMYQRQGASAFKKDLTNINELCWQLGLPQWQFPSIHIAGTNGKGSVSAMLNSILMEAGYRTGMYTSPHLLSFTERISLKGKAISEKDVVQFVDKHRGLIESVQPSFFELTVAMAFYHFAKKAVDIAVVEVGLGGRLDSTNVLKPELSIITNIDYDHQQFLGDSLSQIASEKAGVIKRYTPVVIGQSRPTTAPVFLAKAEENEAPVFWAEQAYRLQRLSGTWKTQKVKATEQAEWGDEREYELGLIGTYQLENLRTVLTAVDILREDGWDIPEKAVARGLKKVVKNSGLRGRMEVLEESPLVLCDTAHNEAGVKVVMEQLMGLEHRKLHLVWGMVSDKEHSEILSLLPKEAHYYFVKPDIPRGLDALTLQMKAEAHGLQGLIFDRVKDGYAAALEAAQPGDLVFVGGSTFVVAEVL